MSTQHIISSILIIDDEPDFCDLLSLYLKRINPSAKIEKVHNLEHGLLALERAEYTVVFLDLHLPDSIGKSTVIKVSSYFSTTAFIVLTGSEDEAIASDLIELGVQDYLFKGDINPRVLLRSISYAIQRIKLVKKLKQKSDDYLDEYERNMQTLSVISSDLKSPIGSIFSAIDAKLQQTNQPDSLDLLIKENAEFCLKLIDEILELRAITEKDFSIDLTPVVLQTLITSVIYSHRKEAGEKGLILRYEYEGDFTDICILCDAYRIRRVLDNLISNAIKFTEKGNIELRIEKGEINSVIISVLDTGIGISDEKLAIILDKTKRYTTYGTSGEIGTGYGLMLSQEIIYQHQSELNIVSSKKGTCISFSLPITAFNLEAPETKHTPL